MRVLLTGSLGLLGQHLLQYAPLQWQLFATLHREREQPVSRSNTHYFPLDITDRRQVHETMPLVRPDIIIHAASMGNLDQCERDPESCLQVNVAGTQHLLDASRKFSPLFLFLSTIYVFDGNAAPYDESAEPNPLSQYAQSKVLAEEVVLNSTDRALIIRPQTLYGWNHPSQRSNCATWLLARLRKGEPSKVVDDVFNNFLWVGDAVRLIVAAVEAQAVGLFHLGGTETSNRYSFSQRVAQVFGYDAALISPVPSSYFPSLARRPRDTTCSNEKVRRTFGITPLNATQGLQEMQRTERGIHSTRLPRSPLSKH